MFFPLEDVRRHMVSSMLIDGLSFLIAREDTNGSFYPSWDLDGWRLPALSRSRNG